MTEPITLTSPTGASRLYPIIGDPIKYGESPTRLTRTLHARDHDGICIPMHVPSADLSAVMASLTATANVDGILFTMPHKFTAFEYCTTRSERANLLNVVSIIRRHTDGTWHGDMLDGHAFVKAQIDQGAQPDGARALLLGAGGAGSAIAIALLEAGVHELTIHDPDETRVNALIDLVANLGHGRAVAGPDDPTDYDMVCNATPLAWGGGPPTRRPNTADRIHVRRRRHRWTRPHTAPRGRRSRRMQNLETRGEWRDHP